MTGTLYKWLTASNGAPIGSGKWQKGRWRSVKGELVACRNGLHLARPRDLIEHISERLWIAEADLSEVVECADKIVVRRARIVERVETINDRTLRAFAADCADRVVHMTGPDPRSVAAIVVARRWARQEATDKELNAAWDAARVAAGVAARVAAGAAAWGAAGAAAWAAARVAARDAAGVAAWAAAWDAGAAARAAAGAAAGDAAWDAGAARLLQYVEHGLNAMDMPWPEAPAWPTSVKSAA